MRLFLTVQRNKCEFTPPGFPSRRAGNYLAEDAAKCDQYVSGDAALGAHPELHARLYPTAGDHPGCRTYYALVCRTTLGAYLRTTTVVSRGCVDLDSGTPVFPAHADGRPNTRELAPIPAISPPAPYHGLVVENRAPIRFREFIVFHGEYAYPEYLLAYKRV